MTASSDPGLLALCEMSPLAAHSRFASADRDEVQSHVADVFCGHSLSVLNRAAALDAELDHIRFGGVALAIMRYGADVIVEPGVLQDFYLVQIPMRGKARISFGRDDAVIKPGRASVQHPAAPLRMHWDAACTKVVLRYDRVRFERFVEGCVGRPQREPLYLHPEMDLSGVAGQMLLDQIKSGLRCASQFGGAALPPLLAAHLESSLMSTLLFTQPHDRSEEFAGAIDGAEPRLVTRVRDYLAAHADEPIDMAMLAEVAGAPVRTIYHQFKRTLGIAPLQLLRDIRMDRVRRELMDGGADANVTRIALGWGFEHLGRFAAQYRERFGETPRDTLRRHRTGRMN
jgi:AraC-like DNA-binding protein